MKALKGHWSKKKGTTTGDVEIAIGPADSVITVRSLAKSIEIEESVTDINELEIDDNKIRLALKRKKKNMVQSKSNMLIIKESEKLNKLEVRRYIRCLH